MSSNLRFLGAVAMILITGCGASPEAKLRRALANQLTGTIRLPSDTIELSSELTIEPGAHDLEIVGGDRSVLKANAGFKGAAILRIDRARNIRLHDFSVEGNREEAPKQVDMVPPENALRVWYADNGILADRTDVLEISRVHLSHVTSFPVLVSRSSGVRIEKVTVTDSGSRNAQGRNNLSGGILIEEGTSDFEVRDSTFQRIAGNALWTHSLRTSPRLAKGVFAGNHIDTVGRDALEVAHATNVRVEDNEIANVGFPVDLIDVEHGGTPVGIDTAGNVDASVYQGNRLDEIDGKCFDLDGFHDGAVRDNQCTDRKRAEDYPFGHFGIVMNNTDPDMQSKNISITGNLISGMKFGGLYLIGSGHTVANNRFLDLNTAGCNESAAKFGCIYKKDEPQMLESGIYLGSGVSRPAETRGNTIQDNVITGHGMQAHCITAAPGVDIRLQVIKGNTCQNESGKAALGGATAR